MASAPAPPRRSTRPHRTVPVPPDRELAPPSWPRRPAGALRPPHLADSATASTSARRSTAESSCHPLPQPADQGAASSTSARERRRSARGGPAAQTVLPDEIWEDIFLRLDAAADLARASAACTSFRRIVSDHRFVRRFRSLCSPAVLGLIALSTTYQSFFPAEPPHRSAQQAHALELATDFTFSFLPHARAWMFRHARDGRVLLSRRISDEIQSVDFLVCDPLYRRHVKIPRIPDDLLAPSTLDCGKAWRLLPVLAPAGEKDGEESFRVICTVQIKDTVIVFVFSSCNQTWQRVSGIISLPIPFIERTPYYAHGFLYWRFCNLGYLLMLDTSEMKFSVINLPNLPLRYHYSRCAVVEAEEGRLGFLSIGNDDTIDLYCKNLQRNVVGAQEWQHNKPIPLPKDSGIHYDWEFLGTSGRYLALVAHHVISDESVTNCEHFVLDMKTLLVEKLCASNKDILHGFPYVGFPPLLALPSI